MHCTRCGKPNQEGALFCWNCGGELADSRPPQSGADVGESGPTLVENDDQFSGAALAAGTMIDGRYRVERLLGQGGMGWVWLTRDVRLDLAVVLKFISPVLGQSASAGERFLREAKLGLGLTHPGIVRLYHLGEWRGQTYLAMEYLEGQNLGQWMEERKRSGQPPAWPEVADVLAQLAEAVVYAHQAGVIHRDLKPANVMLVRRAGSASRPDGSSRPDGNKPRVVVLDFGLAKAIGSAEGPTRLGASLGTPFYMAPEQAHGGGQADQRADVYSIGAIAYEMLTGKVPLGRLVSARQACPALPAEVEGWILGALEPEPEARKVQLEDLARLLRAAPTAPAAPTGATKPEAAKPEAKKAVQTAPASLPAAGKPAAGKSPATEKSTADAGRNQGQDAGGKEAGGKDAAGKDARATNAQPTGKPLDAKTAAAAPKPAAATRKSGWGTLFYIILFILIVYGYWHRAKMQMQQNVPTFHPLPAPTPFKWLGPQVPKNGLNVRPLPTAPQLGAWRGGDGGASEYAQGLKYARGEGVAKDDAQAAQWYRKAADAGHADAMDSLGSAYQNGQGVARDDQMALYWYRKAAEAGSSSGMNDMGWMFQNGRAVVRNSEQAVAWFRKSAEAGNPFGMYNLGLMLESGQGVKKNLDEALGWYEHAASLGKADAQEKVQRLRNMKK